ncbi:hypothetical protein [Micromonospora endophytica]|uniref:Uncharacterized protein n=1 Tax=Micromonospora endophytica TaxID=515350 RepID=A0A2W2DK72_9ACTN|nr:hypothetical protein [Micromonospora endophytica]PZG01210.1 hypothetical protein C1I93_00395 [Micromonospora endophytica]BCJ61883.1 hypothetical protein Jiend_53050 [Micromonospora endophytica]
MRYRFFRAITIAAGTFGLVAASAAVQASPAAARGGATAGHATVQSVTVNVEYESRTRLNGEWLPIEYARNFTVTAPVTVQPEKKLTVRFDSAPILAVAAFNKQLTDLRVAYRITGGTILGYRLEGGSGISGANFWVQRNGADLIVRSNSYFPGGVEFDIPDLVVRVRAAGSGAVVTSPGGSSFADPAFYWFREQTTTGSWDPFENYVDPANPVTFTTTTIG